jgi:hypothetical protein
MRRGSYELPESKGQLQTATLPGMFRMANSAK